MTKSSLGIFETYRRLHDEACRKAVEGARFLYRQGASRVFLFGSITSPDLFMKGSDIDIAVEGLPEEKRFLAEAALIDILSPYDFDLVLLDGRDAVARQEIIEAVKGSGICIERS